MADSCLVQCNNLGTKSLGDAIFRVSPRTKPQALVQGRVVTELSPLNVRYGHNLACRLASLDRPV